MTGFITTIRPVALTSILALGLTPTSYAQTDANLFASHDKNGDGILSTEDSEYLEVAIRMLDKDKSDSIDQTEFKPFTEHSTITIEDPFFFKPSEGRNISSEPIETGEPQFITASILTIDFSKVGKIRYKIENTQPETRPSRGTDFDSLHVEFAPPKETEITFG